MARLLIVSRSMALAMRLADQHEVIEHPANDLDNLIPYLDVDVLVLDLGDPVLAVNTVNALREADQIIPVLLVSGYQPEWEQVEAQQVDGVHVVPLPITRVALLHGVAVLAGEESPSDVADADVPSSDATHPAQRIAPTVPGAAANIAATKAVAARAEANKAAAAKTAAAKAKDEAAKDEAVKREAAKLAAAKSATAKPAPAKPVKPAEEQANRGKTVAAKVAAAEAAARAASSPLNPPDWGIPPMTGEVPAVTRSEQVTGVSYSTSITRPFDEEPRTGQFQTPSPQTPTGSMRWARHGQGAGAVIGDPAEEQPGDRPPSGPTNGNSLARRMPRLGNRPRKLQRRTGQPEIAEPRPAAGRGLVTDPLGPRTDPYGFPASDLDRRLDAEAAGLATRGGEAGFGLRTADLVRLLHERVTDLYSVSDTAQILADDVIERADADAAAILVPDGPIWRVSGGVGLRPLERRLELSESHWLISEIGSGGRAVLIEDTDIIREQLSGAPLAAWRHLLAVPVPAVRGIVVLARGKEGGPFTDRDLSAVIAPVREAAALLAQAVDARRLARKLDPLRESTP
ncbi:MAG TPA: hypothetical protein VLL08_28970 [Kineosporiaceae bacterium]|nr:hypothetical protein [Kineosporiaceae bacterium]